MKRFIIILSLIAMFPFMASAQLNIEKKVDKFETIATMRVGVIKLLKSADSYCIQMKSTNQFDSLCFFYLGKELDGSKQTLKDLLTIMETIKKSEIIVVKDALGKEFKLTKDMGTLYLDTDGYAGRCTLTKGEINKMITSIK